MSNRISVRKSNPETTAAKKSTVTPWVGAAAGAAVGLVLPPSTRNMGKKRARMVTIGKGVGGAILGLAGTALYNARCP